MKRIFSVLLVVGLLAAMVLGAPIASAAVYPDYPDNKKVKICHYPPGNPDNVHIISVSENAVQAHMENHGDKYPDKYGKCPKPPKKSHY